MQSSSNCSGSSNSGDNMSTEDIKWEPYQELSTPLHHYGKVFSQRFMAKQSTLHDVQKQALQALVKWFKDSETKDLTAVVVMPTGTGKSGVICCLPYMIGGAIEDGKISKSDIDFAKGAILIITPGLDILHQIHNDLDRGKFLENRGLLTAKDLEKNVIYTVYKVVRGCRVSTLHGGEANIILSNAQKWRKEKDRTPIYQDLRDDIFSMIIVDEAHHLPAPQWKDIVEKFQRHAKIVFFTATPNRTNGKEITTDNAISTRGYAYELTRIEAIQDNLIRDVEFHSINSQSQTQGRRNAGTKAVERMAHGRKVVYEVIRRMDIKNQEHPLPDGIKHASILIARNIVEANKVHTMCTAQGINGNLVTVVHSETIRNPKMRKQVIDKIREGQLQIVIIVQMLLEGFDYPPFTIAGIVTPIRSLVKFTQFIGRIQRVVPGEGREMKADIITHEYFEQKGLFKEYIKPEIKDDENENLDEDDENEY